MKLEVKKLLKQIFIFILITSLFYSIFILLSHKKWLMIGGGTEAGLYVTASSYINKLYQGLLQIRSLKEFSNWLIAFFFHLSPFDIGEKPLFIMGLGYFSLVHTLFLKWITIPVDSLFNIFLMGICGYLLFLVFYNLLMNNNCLDHRNNDHDYHQIQFLNNL